VIVRSFAWKTIRVNAGYSTPIIPHTQPLWRGVREVVTVQVWRPLEAKLVHQLLATILSSQTQGPAGGQRILEDGADRGVDCTQEDLKMRGALDLDQGEELVNLHTCILLFCVPQQVWNNGLVILNIGTEGDGDGFTFAMSDLHVTTPLA